MNERRTGEGISDVAMLVVIGCAVAAGALVWVWGGIAGALFGGGWPGLGSGQLLEVMTRLPTHLSDPASAWPAPLQAQLPGPRGAYGSLAVPALAVAGTCMLVSRLRLLRFAPGVSNSGSRWSGASNRGAQLGRVAVS